MAETQIQLIATVAAVFVGALFGVVLLLSLLRRLRDRQRHSVADVFAELSDETRPMSAVGDTEKLAPLAALSPVVQDQPSKPKRPPLPESARLPVQAGTPDQVVLSIEPPDGPNRDQRNVQKLIAFLKQETAEAEAEPIQKVS